MPFTELKKTRRGMARGEVKQADHLRNTRFEKPVKYRFQCTLRICRS